jgi:diguanylate cyclase (GGDEF)-like protein
MSIRRRFQAKGTALIGFVFLLGILNIALGYGVALALADRPFGDARFIALRPKFGWPRLRWPSFRRLEPVGFANSASSPAAGSVAAALPAELPRAWLDQLAEAELAPTSFVEGVAHVLRLDVAPYREQLLTAEWRTRRALADSDGPGLTLLRDDLKNGNDAWLQLQTAAAGVLTERRGRLGLYEEAGTALERVLFEQAGQVRALNESLAALACADDPPLAGKRLLAELGRLIDLAHALRDQMHDCLAGILRDEQRLETTPNGLQIDATTGLLNRIGVEVMFHQWLHEDAENSRMASLVLVDIDRFGKLNERLGTRTGDRTLQALGQTLSDLARRDRGYDRVARFAGQSFLLFLGNTGPHNATCCAERVRQTLEATTFDSEGNQFELALSCGVVAIGKQESIAEALKRATLAVREAKKLGRNRTALDEGQGPEFVDPPTYHVKGGTVAVQ